MASIRKVMAAALQHPYGQPQTKADMCLHVSSSGQYQTKAGM